MRLRCVILVVLFLNLSYINFGISYFPLYAGDNNMCFMSTSYEYCCRHEALFLYELVCLFLEHYLKIYCIYCNPSPLYISLGCHKQMHRQKKKQLSTQTDT